MKIAALVLAAGGSSRLGQPKQLLQHEGATLVRRAAEAALGADFSPVVIVVGRERAEIARELGDLPVQFLPNENWERGIGSSIHAGVGALEKVEAVVILACDQPALTPSLLRELAEEYRRGEKLMVACAYAGTVGVPALFDREYFSDLCSLGDDEGAKKLLLSQPNDLATIEFPGGAVDIDTPADLAALTARRRKSAERIR